MLAEEYDAFEHLCDAVFSDDEDGLMFFWKSHFDASGKEPLLVVAGYLAQRPDWKSFNKAWKEPLTSRGHTDIFHATDFEAGLGDFTAEKGWTVERRNSVRVRLVEALEQSSLRLGVACSVVVSDYDEMMTGWRREHHGDAYNYCVNGCIKVFGVWLQAHRCSDPIATIVESGDEGSGEAQETFRKLHANPNTKNFFRLGSLAFLHKSQAVGLQAADMLAHYVWDYETGTQPLVEPYSRILRDKRLILERYDKAAFKKLFERDDKGLQIQYPEGLWTFDPPRSVDIEVSADFSFANEVLEDLESLVETQRMRFIRWLKTLRASKSCFAWKRRMSLQLGHIISALDSSQRILRLKA